MTPAPVGQQCPDCVAEGKRTVRQVRTIFGGKAITRPTITYTLIGINVVIFVVGLLTGSNAMLGRFGMQPVLIATHDDYYRLFTSMFMHASIVHIGFNMLVLWIVGQQLEVLLGHSRYLVLYLVSGLAGMVVSFWFSPLNTNAVGASGAIFGLMGGLLVAGRQLRYDVTQVASLIGINLVIGFFIPNVDWRAHVGGLAGGVLMGIVFAHGPKKNRVAFEVGATLLIVAALVVATMIRVQRIRNGA